MCILLGKELLFPRTRSKITRIFQMKFCAENVFLFCSKLLKDCKNHAFYPGYSVRIQKIRVYFCRHAKGTRCPKFQINK